MPIHAAVADSYVARLATVSATGAPALTPLWFVVDDDHLIMATAAATLAARNSAANRRVSVLLDAERAGPSTQVLRLAATARVHEGLAPWRMLARFARKYYVTPPALRHELANARRWRLRTRYYGQSDGVWLEIEPTRAELLRNPPAGQNDVP